MQVTARVLPGRHSWGALADVRVLAQELAGGRSGAPGIRRARLVRTSAELRNDGDRPRLVITLHHPHN